MYDFTVELGGIPVGFSCFDGFCEDFCHDYIVQKAPAFSVRATKEEITREVNAASEEVSERYAEALCLYRHAAEILPLYNRVVFHGAAIEYEGKAYLFCAPSGTGKTTHISLWKRFLGEKVSIINGDKPILNISDGKVTVYGTPYAGKEGWQSNVCFPLGAICVLERSTVNTCKEIPSSEALLSVLKQTYRPCGRESAVKTLELVGNLSESKTFLLGCNMTEEAVKVSFEALTGYSYEERKKS